MKDRFDLNEHGCIRDLHRGELMTNSQAVDVLNAHERVLIRVIEVIEQREEAT